MKRSKLGASDLDSIISIESYSDTPDGMGGSSRTWSVLIARLHCKAQMNDKSLKENAQSGAVPALSTIGFTCRQRSDILTTHRVVYGGVRYNIRGIARDTTRDRMMTIIAESGVADG